MSRGLLVVAVGASILACSGLELPEPDAPAEDAPLCSAAGIRAALTPGNPHITAVTQFGCKHEHALAKVTLECPKCVPEMMFYLAQTDGSWRELGSGHTLDEGLCEGNPSLGFDQCEELFAAYNAAK